MIVLLSLPGDLFALLVLAGALFDLKPLYNSALVVQLGAMAFFGGVLSVLTTPVSVLCTLVWRKRLKSGVGFMAWCLVAMAVVGWSVFVLSYLNPFYHD